MFRKFYKKVRKRMPGGMKSEMTKLVFAFSNKPFVRKDNIPFEKKFPGGKYRGGMVISADFELGWAWRYSKTNPQPDKMAAQARKNFPEIIRLLDEYNIPITFATVGHLFLESCEKGDHDWMERIPYFDDHWRYTEGDWFDADPCTHWEKAKHWYAPDLVKMIIDARAGHELATHTFTHIDFSDKNCPPQVAEDELKASIEAMKPYGVRPESIVFPGGTFGNTNVLKKMNFRIYRKNTPDDLAYPFYDELGLVVTPTSWGFMKQHNWSSDYYIKRFKIYIDKAIKTGTVAHFWFHPSLDEWTLSNVMPEVMKYAAQKREEGALWIGTMKEIADHINKTNKK
jgi:peptidoglycan/xylan/chitin deacetylase (PgdA/CDA1 family)